MQTFLWVFPFFLCFFVLSSSEAIMGFFISLILTIDYVFWVAEMESTFSSDLSSGYLEDAIVAWSNRCKRRRMLSYSPDQVAGFSKVCLFSFHCLKRERERQTHEWIVFCHRIAGIRMFKTTHLRTLAASDRIILRF